MSSRENLGGGTIFCWEGTCSPRPPPGDVTVENSVVIAINGIITNNKTPKQTKTNTKPKSLSGLFVNASIYTFLNYVETCLLQYDDK